MFEQIVGIIASFAVIGVAGFFAKRAKSQMEGDIETAQMGAAIAAGLVGSAFVNIVCDVACLFVL